MKEVIKKMTLGIAMDAIADETTLELVKIGKPMQYTEELAAIL